MRRILTRQDFVLPFWILNKEGNVGISGGGPPFIRFGEMGGEIYWDVPPGNRLLTRSFLSNGELAGGELAK